MGRDRVRDVRANFGNSEKFHSRFRNSAGGVNARQGPRISIRMMPWRRLVVVRKSTMRDLRLFDRKGATDAKDSLCLSCDDGRLRRDPSASDISWPRGGSLVAWTLLDTFSSSALSHRAKKVTNVRKRKTAKAINGSILI